MHSTVDAPSFACAVLVGVFLDEVVLCAMKYGVEHLENDLCIDEEPSTSNYLSNSVAVESSLCCSASQKTEECIVLTPRDDRFKKRTHQSTSMDSFLVKHQRFPLLHQQPQIL